MNLAEIRRWLKERNIQLTKALGQNFLHDPQQLERIVAAAHLSRSDQVLEIGPGLGPLTECLLQRAGQVLAVEKDRRLVQVLTDRFQVGAASRLSAHAHPPHESEQETQTHPPRVDEAPELSAKAGGEVSAETGGGVKTGGTPVLQLVHDDALEWLKSTPRDWSDWKVVSNLPYSVASPLLVELCRGPRSPQLLVVTLQYEVVQRLRATAGGKEYGVLTLLVQLDFEPVSHFKIARTCFFPEPDVDSACIVLRRRAAPPLPEALRPLFIRVVKRAFSQRRKMMKNLLRAEWPAAVVEAGMAAVGIDPMARAEVVSLTQFAALTEQLAAGPRPASTEEIFDVVNERDEVIGCAPRAEVHARGLRHRAVHVLVFNARGEVFLQKRSLTKDKSPGLWDSSASGHVDRGEIYDACAVRELHEEIGLTPAAPLERLFQLAASEATDQEHVWVYRCQAEGPFQLNPAELERGQWIAPAELTRWIARRPADFAGAFRVLWTRLWEAGPHSP